MQPLRFRWFWLFAGIALIAGVLVYATAEAPPGLVYWISDKTWHLVTFLVLMLWFSGIFRFGFSPLVALGLLGYGLLIEYLQSRLSFRFAEAGDVLFDIYGIGAGWILAGLGARHWCAVVESWLPVRKSRDAH